MLILATIFTLAVSLLFLLSGVTKLLALKETVDSIIKLKLFPPNIALLIGICLPLTEIIVSVAMFLLGGNMVVVVLALLLIIIFMVINFKAILDGNQTNCHCFGKLLQTRTGYGGLLQCLLLIVSLIPNFIWDYLTPNELIELFKFVEVIICSILWTVTLILFRRIIEILYPSSSQY